MSLPARMCSYVCACTGVKCVMPLLRSTATVCFECGQTLSNLRNETAHVTSYDVSIAVNIVHAYNSVIRYNVLCHMWAKSCDCRISNGYLEVFSSASELLRGMQPSRYARLSGYARRKRLSSFALLSLLPPLLLLSCSEHCSVSIQQ
jgi:hypothetical protein